VLNSTGSAACLCKCGFSGATCSSGYRDNCNDRGTCSASTNHCTCTPGATTALYTGDACQRTNCPVDANNNLCSNRGACVILRNDAQCNCTAGFNGTACDNTIVEETRTGQHAGFGVVQLVTDKASAGIKINGASPVAAPTEAPVSAPVSAPTFSPAFPPALLPSVAKLEGAGATITPTLLVGVLRPPNDLSYSK
jgi:hypothetical protein